MNWAFIVLMSIVGLSTIDMELQVRGMRRRQLLFEDYLKRLEQKLPAEPPRAVTGRWKKPTGLSQIRYSRAGDLTRPADVDEPTETRQFPLE